MAGAAPPAGAVDQRLGMLDPHADRKGLALHRHPLALQHREAIAGAMAHRQHHLRGGDAAAIGQHHGPNGAAVRLQFQLIHPALEPDLPAEGFDLGPQAPDHRGQFEGADVGPVQHQNLRIGTGLHQLLEHLAAQVAGVTHLAVELAVGEGARTSLPELGIGFRVEGALAAPEAEGVGAALLHRLAPLQQQWPQAHLGQQQRAEIAAGAGPHHHRPRDRALLQPTADGGAGVGYWLIAAGLGRLQLAVAAEALE